MLLTVILADAINLGLAKMAEACPGTTFHKLDNLRAWHVRDETYSKALAEIVNYQHLERATGALREQGRQIDDGLLKHVAPIHWNHINLTGDYSWCQNKCVEKGGFRPLRLSPQA
jgi:hypothetical protein